MNILLLRRLTRPLYFTLVAMIGSSSSGQAATRMWDGGGANNNWLTPANWADDSAPAAGDDLLFPAGAAQPASFNDFPVETVFSSLIFSGGTYALSGNAITLTNGIVATNGSNHTIDLAISLNNSQTFLINLGSANFNFAGAIQTGGHNLTFQVTAPTLVQFNGQISGAGGLVKTASGSVYLNVSNSFSGPVQLLGGFINVADSGALGTKGGITTVSNGATLLLLNSVTVAEPLVLGGTLRAAGGGVKTCTGPITTVSGNPSINVDVNAVLVISAVIGGSNGLTKNLTGMLTLNSNNTYTGSTTLNDGTLVVNGSQPQSPVLINRGTVGGIGVVGPVSVASNGAKNLRPGNSPGILTCNGLTADVLTSLQMELNGPLAGTSHDQLSVNGLVALTNSSLSVTSGLPLTVGDSFVIVDNDGNDPVLGSFGGLAEGAILSAGGQALQITYTGGTGNDIVLTRIKLPALWIQSLAQTGNGYMNGWATGGVPGFTYMIEAATNLNPGGPWSNLFGVFPAANSNLFFTDVNAPLFPTRYYRIRSP